MRYKLLAITFLLSGCATYDFGHYLIVTNESGWHQNEKGEHIFNCADKEVAIVIPIHRTTSAMTSFFTFGIPFLYFDLTTPDVYKLITIENSYLTECKSSSIKVAYKNKSLKILAEKNKYRCAFSIIDEDPIQTPLNISFNPDMFSCNLPNITINQDDYTCAQITKFGGNNNKCP